MEEMLITTYYNGHWDLLEGTWTFVGEKGRKAILVNQNIRFEELVEIIVDRFKINLKEDEVTITHANIVQPNLKPYIIDCDEDITSFVFINKRATIPWSVPLCVTSSKKVGDNLIKDTEAVFEDSFVEMGCGSGYGTKERSYMEYEITPTASQRVTDEKESGGEIVDVASGVSSVSSKEMIKKGQCFKSKDELNVTLALHALSQCFQFKVKKSNKNLLVIVCIDSKCCWRVRASKLKNSDIWFIGKHLDAHTCAYQTRITKQKQATAKVIAHRVRSMYDGVKKGPIPAQLINTMEKEFGMKTSYWKCWKAKQAAENMVHGRVEESFGKLASYLYMLQSVNPGTIVRLEVDGVDSCFKYCFFAFGQSIRGYHIMRKVISVDGTFLKGKYGGVLLVAVAQDANYQIYPIAFAIVDGETEAAWDFFFKNLKIIVPDCNEQVFISDRHKAIKKAILVNYSQVKHGICHFHLKMNVKSKCRLKKIHDMFTMAAESYRKVDFMKIYDQICEENKLVGEYLAEAGIEAWSRAYFQGKRYNIMTSNNAESVNSVLRFDREYNILALIDAVRDKLREWFEDRRQRAIRNGEAVPQKIQEIIKSRYEIARKLTCKTLNSSLLEFEVRGGEYDVVVRLNDRTCSCRVYDLDEIPCVHAIAVAIDKGIDLYSLVGPYFLNSCLLECYEGTIYPVPDKEEWTVPHQVKDITCNPPKKRRRSGRPKKIRFRSSLEVKRRKCSCCGKLGHNKKTCIHQPAAEKK